MGSDISSGYSRSNSLSFQSTLPVWGATTLYKVDMQHFIFQSTLPVWGATIVSGTLPRMDGISIHTPRMGSDFFILQIFLPQLIFQSTLPVWGATAQIHKKIFAIDKRLHILHKVQMAYLGLSPCLDQYLLRFAKKPARTPPKNSGSYPFAPL